MYQTHAVLLYTGRGTLKGETGRADCETHRSRRIRQSFLL